MAPVESEAFPRIEQFVRSELLGWYIAQGDLAFGYASGSLVEGLADTADLDLVLVWHEAVPEAPSRLPFRVADAKPGPTAVEQSAFHLDRFFVGGQQIDVKHITLPLFEEWVSAVEAGEGASGYPMPVIALHGFTSGMLLEDGRGLAAAYANRMKVVPRAFVTASRERLRSSLPSYLNELDLCVSRGDGLLFHSLTVDMVRLAFIAWFAKQGMYWPHEKRLRTRLLLLGVPDVAAAEARVWEANSLSEKRELIGDLLKRLAL